MIVISIRLLINPLQLDKKIYHNLKVELEYKSLIQVRGIQEIIVINHLLGGES